MSNRRCIHVPATLATAPLCAASSSFSLLPRVFNFMSRTSSIQQVAADRRNTQFWPSCNKTRKASVLRSLGLVLAGAACFGVVSPPTVSAQEATAASSSLSSAVPKNGEEPRGGLETREERLLQRNSAPVQAFRLALEESILEGLEHRVDVAPEVAEWFSVRPDRVPLHQTSLRRAAVRLEGSSAHLRALVARAVEPAGPQAASAGLGEAEQAAAGAVARGSAGSGARLTRLQREGVVQASAELLRDLEAFEAEHLAAGRRLAQVGVTGPPFARWHAAGEQLLVRKSVLERALASALAENSSAVSAKLKAVLVEEAARSGGFSAVATSQKAAELALAAKRLDDLTSALRPTALAQLLALLPNQRRSEPATLRAAIPYADHSEQRRSLPVATSVIPPYADVSDPTPAADDLNGFGIAPLSPAIVRQAEQLGYDALAIYEFVQAQIATEWYPGAMKGAEATLISRSGSPTDQATLLSALLRAGGHATRYVYGVIEMNVERLGDWLGVQGSEAVGAALSKARLAHEPVIQGGRVAAFRIEHTWIGARVPFGNYRGATVDLSEPTWVPLDSSFKAVGGPAPNPVLRQLLPDASARVATYLAALQPEDLLTQLRQEVEAALAEAGVDDPRWQSQLGEDSINAAVLGLLPASLPYEVVHLTSASSTLPAELVHTTRFRLADSQNAPLLDQRIATWRLGSRRVTLSFLPATLEDELAIFEFGGLLRTPPYLVHLRPQIVIDGRRFEVGQGGLPMASTADLLIDLELGSHSVELRKSVVAGASYSFAIATPTLRATDVQPVRADIEPLGARLLAARAADYVSRWDRDEDALARLYGLRVFRPWPSLAIAGVSTENIETQGLVSVLDVTAAALDAPFRASGAVPSDAAALAESAGFLSSWRRLSGLQGSALERFVFERDFAVPSISADTGLGLASAQGVIVRSLQPADEAQVSTLAVSESARAEISEWLNRGFVVDVADGPVARGDWQGAVWRVEEPSSGVAGYFIQGSLAGGSTADHFDEWSLQFLADALDDFGDSVSDDESAVTRIQKLPETDRQITTVNTLLADPLAVRVLDEFGRGVAGVEVTFAIARGEGAVFPNAHDSQESEAQITTLSDSAGIARAPLRLGQTTRSNPIMLGAGTPGLGDVEFHVEALLHEVEAVALGSGGQVVLDEPFLAYGLPGEPTQIVRTSPRTEHFMFGFFIGYDVLETGRGPRYDFVQVLDEFENPVPNQALTVTAVGSGPSGGCAQPDVVYEPTLVDLPASCSIQNGECGDRIIEIMSSAEPVGFGVIPSNVIDRSTTVEVALGDSGAAQYTFVYGTTWTETPVTTDDGETLCNGTGGWGTPEVSSPRLTNGFGDNIQAALPGEKFEPIDFQIISLAREYVVVPFVNEAGETRYKDVATPQVRWAPLSGNINLEVDPEGEADSALVLGEGFQTGVRLGATPGLHELQVYATSLTYSFIHADFFTGALLETQLPVDPLVGRHVNEVWAVLPSVRALVGPAGEPTEPTVRLTDTGRTEEAIFVDYGWTPLAYKALTAELQLLEDDVPIHAVPLPWSESGGVARLQRGLEFSLLKQYSLQLILNRGSPAEVLSQSFALELDAPILRDVAPRQSFELDAELTAGSSDGEVCFPAKKFQYSLAQPAEVTLTVRRVNGIGDVGSAQEIFRVDREAGSWDYDFVGGSFLQPGVYEYELRALAPDGSEEVKEGTLKFSNQSYDRLSLSRSYLHNVDLSEGGLVLQRDDFAFQGLGRPISFSRSYASGRTDSLGPLGAGWSHSYDSKVTLNGCGKAVVVGGAGSGMRFSPGEDDGEWVPTQGYHGTLVTNEDDSSYDLYVPDGTRYHYFFEGGQGEWPLEFIEDTNGNRTTLTYSGEGLASRLTGVLEDSGRSLQIDSVYREFEFDGGFVINSVIGSDGIRVDFDYDEWGNLIEARREDGIRLETYGYGQDASFVQRHTLTSVTNGLSGATTSYTVQSGAIAATPTVVRQQAQVTGVQLPEGGLTEFAYDATSLSTFAALELHTVVTDPRGGETDYFLNRLGGVVRMVDALEETSTTTWNLEHLKVASHTDRRGVVTSFEYDEHGNITKESVVGALGELAERTMSYWSPTEFSPANAPAGVDAIKTRLQQRTDRKGASFSFSYDETGNLLRESGPVAGWTRTHSYYSTGQRSSTTDANGHRTSFAYDEYGHLSQVTDAEGGVTDTVWLPRSLPLEQRDARGELTTFDHDSLGRVTQKELPPVPGQAGTETTVYDDVGRMVTKHDALSRASVTEFDREGRVVAMVNASGARREVIFNPAGDKSTEVSWSDVGTPPESRSFTYDLLGRLSERLDPEGRRTVYSYDAVGNVLSEETTDVNDTTFARRRTEFAYDFLGRMIEKRRLAGAETAAMQMEYDGEGNKLLERDALGREMTFVYDGLNRLVEVTAPDFRPGSRTETTREWDGNGNLIAEVISNEKLSEGSWVPAHQSRTFEYDGLNRLVESVDAEGNISSREYDAVGNLLVEIDPRPSRIEHAYDARNRRIETLEQLASGNLQTQFEVDAVGNVVKTTLPNGNEVEQTYDTLNRPTTSSDALGPLLSMEYDARGNVTASEDALGRRTETTYDGLNRALETHLPEDRTESYGYDVVSNRLSQEDALGRETRFEYDRLDRLVTTRFPDVGTGLGGDGPPASYEASATYDLAGNRLTETDALGRATSFTYDALNRVVLETSPDPLNYTRGFAYDAVGNLVQEIDGRGIVTEHTFDRENRRVKQRRDGVLMVANTYDGKGNRIGLTDANGNTTTWVYDERNLVLQESAPLAAITHFVRDSMGDVVEETDPEGRLTLRTFDVRRRQTSETNGLGETAEFVYDLAGNRTEVHRPQHPEAPWLSEYDAANRLTSVTDPLGHATLFEYDKASNLSAQIDANGRRKTSMYDAWNRRVGMTTAVGTGQEASRSWGYDGASNLVEERDYKGQLTASAFDVINRLALREFALPEVPTGNDLLRIERIYDENSNPTQITETYSGLTGSRITQRSYDNFDRLSDVTDARGEHLHYDYDPNGNRTRLVDADGTVTSYDFDAVNRMSFVLTTTGGEPVITTYSYTRASELAGTVSADGLVTEQAYDSAGRLESITNSVSTAITSSYVYTYDANGNRLTQVEVNGGAMEETTYAYDTSDRLIEVAYPEETVTTTYDAVGNRLTEITVDSAGGPSSDKTWNYDARDRLTQVSDALNASGTVTYTYDANGNQRSRTQNGTIRDQQFDVRNQLTEISDGGSMLMRFLYDHSGLRVRKSGPNGVVRYVYDDRAVLQQTDDNGATISKYEYGPDRLLSMHHTTEGRQHYAFDGLGSVVNLVKSTGALQARYQYDAWGNPRGGAGSSFSPFGFTGHELDGETGLYYAKARFYDPEAGRFLSEDLFEGTTDDPPSLHRYTYAKVNPTVYWDPTGEIAILRELADRFRRGGVEAAAELSGLISDLDFLPQSVKADAALALGVLGAGAETAAGAVDAVNVVANALVAGAAPNSSLGQESADELVETERNVRTAVRTVIENPGAVAKAVGQSVVDTAVGVATGDAEAVTRATAFAAELGAGAGVAGQGVRAARRGGRRASRSDAEVGTGSADPELVRKTNAGQRGGEQTSSGGTEAGPAIIESRGANLVENGTVMGSARTSRSIVTSIRAALGEAEAYKQALRDGEIGLQSPLHANAPGPDFITAQLDSRGQFRIFVTDVKSSTVGRFPTPKTFVRTDWGKHVREALERLDLGNPELEALVRDAFDNGRVFPRQTNVDYSPSGQGRIE